MTDEVIDQPVADATPVSTEPTPTSTEPTPTSTEPTSVVETVVQEVETVLSDATHRVHAWIKSMADFAPHHSQMTFEAFLTSNIASLETFVHKQGD